MGFSEHFLTGLSTKSDHFQREFFSIIDTFEQFFDYDQNELNEFQDYIESQFSYYEKGNLLYSMGGFVGGESEITRKDEYIKTIILKMDEILRYELEGEIPSHLMVAVKCQKDIFDVDELGSVLRFNALLFCPKMPPEVCLYLCTSDENIVFEYFIAAMR